MDIGLFNWYFLFHGFLLLFFLLYPFSHLPSQSRAAFLNDADRRGFVCNPRHHFSTDWGEPSLAISPREQGSHPDLPPLFDAFQLARRAGGFSSLRRLIAQEGSSLFKFGLFVTPSV